MKMVPPASVRAAFRCEEEPIAVTGGEGETYRCGRIVLKPCRDAEEAGWIAQLYREIEQKGFRLPRPVEATDGRWVVEGWQAWTFLDGTHRRDRWDEVIRACRAFHEALRYTARPAFFAHRDTPFSRADRIAWGETRSEFHPRILPLAERLQALLRPVNLSSQVIHADMTENVLFEPGLPPAIIDFSPYWRPAEYAQAIIVVDAMDWCGASESILTLVSDVPDIYQLMVRAELFRLAILDELFELGVDTLSATVGHTQTIDLLERRLAAGPDVERCT